MYRENSSVKSNRTRLKDTLREDQYTVFIISRLCLLRLRNISGKRFRENHNTNSFLSNFFFENHTVYDIM
jgi:hypothetical protein